MDKAKSLTVNANKTLTEPGVNKNMNRRYWIDEVDEELIRLPGVAVVAEQFSPVRRPIPLFASGDSLSTELVDVDWLEREIRSTIEGERSRPAQRIQTVDWAPEHAFVVEIAHLPASPPSSATEKGLCHETYSPG